MGFLPGGCNSLDRKDKQAQVLPGPSLSSPLEKTSKPRQLPPGPCFLDRKDKQASSPGTGLLHLFCQKRQASSCPQDIHRLFNDLGPSFFKLGPRTLVKGQKSRCFESKDDQRLYLVSRKEIQAIFSGVLLREPLD